MLRTERWGSKKWKQPPLLCKVPAPVPRTVGIRNWQWWSPRWYVKRFNFSRKARLMMHVSGCWKAKASRREPVGSSHEKDSTREECFRVITSGASYGGQSVPEVGPVTSGASTVLEKSKIIPGWSRILYCGLQHPIAQSLLYARWVCSWTKISPYWDKQ